MSRQSWTLIHAVAVALCVLVAYPPPADAQDLPFTATWTNVPDLQTGTLPFEAGVFEYRGLLTDGRAVFTAFRPDEPKYYARRSIVLFNPQSNSWEWKSRPPVQDYTGYGMPLHVQPLSDGRCLVTGHNQENHGSAPMLTYIWDPTSDTYTQKATLPVLWRSRPPEGIYPSFSAQSITRLPGDEVYVFGTKTGAELREPGPIQGFIYSLVHDTWREGPRIDWETSCGFRKYVYPDGRMCGLGNQAELHDVYNWVCFDPVRMEWNVGPKAGDLEYSHLARVCGINNRMYCLAKTTTVYPDDNLYSTYMVDRESLRMDEVATGKGPLGLPVIAGLAAAGRDWAALFWTATDKMSAACGIYDGQVYDESASRWLNLPRCPKDVLVPSTHPTYPYAHAETIPLADGLLLMGWVPNVEYGDGIVRSARLRISSAAVPPQIIDDVPDVDLDEGTSQTFGYKLTGDVPAEGVDVVVERLSGDGDVRLVDGARQRVIWRGMVKTVRIVANTDADNVDDQAVIRLRIVQPGGGDDPNARTIAVTVRDLYQQATQMPGDVNGDGVVNAADLDEVVRNFGKTAGGN